MPLRTIKTQCTELRCPTLISLWMMNSKPRFYKFLEFCQKGSKSWCLKNSLKDGRKQLKAAIKNAKKFSSGHGRHGKMWGAKSFEKNCTKIKYPFEDKLISFSYTSECTSEWLERLSEIGFNVKQDYCERRNAKITWLWKNSSCRSKVGISSVDFLSVKVTDITFVYEQF